MQNNPSVMRNALAQGSNTQTEDSTTTSTQIIEEIDRRESSGTTQVVFNET